MLLTRPRAQPARVAAARSSSRVASAYFSGALFPEVAVCDSFALRFAPSSPLLQFAS